MKDIADGVVTPDKELIPDTRAFPNGDERDYAWTAFQYGPDMFYHITWREVLYDGCGCGCFWPIAIIGGALLLIGGACLLHYILG